MQSYTDLMPCGHQRSRWHIGPWRLIAASARHGNIGFRDVAASEGRVAVWRPSIAAKLIWNDRISI
jgi:hypothetical protein